MARLQSFRLEMGLTELTVASEIREVLDLIEGDQKARPIIRGSPSSVVFYLLLGAVAFLALSVCSSLAYDTVGSKNEVQGETVTGSIVLDVYLDAEGSALIVGYIETERLEDLAFLEGAELFYDEDAGELYALGGGLTWVHEYGTRLEFEAEGGWEECHLAFYLPKDAEMLAISCSEALEYKVAEAEDSLKVEVLGYGVEGIEVAIDYAIS